MINDYDSDQEDDDPYKNDALILHVKKNWKDPDQDWSGLGIQLSEKITDIVNPSEKFTYLMATIDASKYAKPIIKMTIPIMASLYDDLFDSENKVRCATFVNSYSEDKELSHKALAVIEDNYIRCTDMGYRITALGCLLNDDRVFDGSDEERYDAQVDYFNEWLTLFNGQDEHYKATSAYEVLQPLKLFNAFKPILLEFVGEHLNTCPDPKSKLEMVLFCNREFESDNGEKSYRNPAVDKEFFPILPLYNWEVPFFESALAVMNKEGHDDVVGYICESINKDKPKDWVYHAYAVLDFAQDPFVVQEAKTLSDLFDLKANIFNQDVKSPSGLLKKKQDYLNWGVNLHELALKDGMVNEIDIFEQLRSNFEFIKNISNKANNSVRMQMAINEFKFNFLTTVITGQKVFNQEVYNNITRSKDGEKPMFAYARMELNKTEVLGYLFAQELNTINSQLDIVDNSLPYRYFEDPKKQNWVKLKEEIKQNLDYDCYPKDYQSEAAGSDYQDGYLSNPSEAFYIWRQPNKEGKLQTVARAQLKLNFN